ncbi:hypothetical protein IE53DRAFT_125366 [Violaceomyces palustris]|uniref:Uncharacterized protein n=1 Tax=Violaceomyces palustris TaxID=1673888 RepID=A0ACD0P6M5_9BASI|nr:hypothetical protein IE53DRAFT_125366 [Violaceomyces palustris]
MLTIPSSSMATFSNIDIESQSSPSSRNLSDPSNTAAASSSSAIQRQPGQLKRARRTHAKRTCLSCRTNKVRCELPDLQVPSSLDPLPSEKACHRCNVLNLDCVVYDADRKRARNSITTSTTNKKNNKNTSSTEKKLEDGNDNDQSNNPQGSLDSSTKAERKSTAAPRKQPKQSEYQKQKGKLIQDARPQSLAHILEPFQLFSGENESELPDRSGNGSTALNDSDEDVDQLDESIEAQPNASSQDDSSSAKKNDAHITIKRPPIWLKYHMTPLGLLRTLVARHPGFGSDLPDMDPNLSFREVLLVLKLLPEKLSQRIAAVSEMLFLYFPHLPSLPNLLAQHTSAPTLSSALLLTTIYFISLRQCSGFADTKQLKERLKVYIRQMGIQVMLTLPKSTYAVQALELLASYEPLDLMGIDHDLSSLDKLSVPGESQIVAAIHIAQLLKMNDSIELLRDPNDHIKLETRSKRIEDSLVWFSISSTKSALTSKEPDPNVSSESLETFGNEIVRLSQHSSKERSEDRLRDAGRLGVLHRFRRLKMLHTRWAEIIGCYYPTDRPLNEAIRDADSLLEKFGSESIELEYERHLALGELLRLHPFSKIQGWRSFATGWITNPRTASQRYIRRRSSRL